MKKTKFSINDVVVLKENDKLANNQLAKIVGGVAGCVCKCGSNSGTLAAARVISSK
ncbi:MAG: hypothetical protein LBS01_10670 [Prevotellaceae bacterium]|jgi:hypothetical protein|nr:hypothetical protein [Prevotellaceae bacterium]